ncbi:MAG: hypothetical protein JNM56_10205 [Planctomycetia bacterium]|nr:hypothetical protein [Planctomycetia bacterium]
MATEQYANNAQTTLNGAIGSGDTTLTVVSATGFPGIPQFRIRIDNELLLVTAGAGTTSWNVTRGIESTPAAGHSNGATVTQVLTAGGLKNVISGTTVERDLGSTPKWSGKFTITDAAITASSKVLCWQAPGPYTGKGTLADEAEMQPVQVIAVEPAAGSAVVKWQTPPMTSHALLLTIGSPGAGQPSRDQVTVAVRLGKVRGNVKFTYMVLS